MLVKMAALLFAFYLFDMSYVKVKVYQKTGYGLRGKNRRLPRALRNFKPEFDVHFYLYTEKNLKGLVFEKDYRGNNWLTWKRINRPEVTLNTQEKHPYVQYYYYHPSGCFSCVLSVTSGLLSSRFNPHEGHKIIPEKPSSLFISHFDFDKNVKILIHGWKNTGNSTFGRTVKDAYITHMGVNVIVVDWHKLSRHAYHRSCRHMDLVAMRVAILYDFLRLYVARQAIHIIGHSLGAHVAGIAGEVVTRGKIHRITGLDPAGPMISKMRTRGRLDKQDAQFVDIIHTSGFMLGFYSALGHADFYPNKGTPIQPGCGVDVVGRCSHRRSYHLFQESIFNQSKFMALQCQNWKHFVKNKCSSLWHRMGEHIEYGIEGKFFLRTARKSPFDLGCIIDLKSINHNSTTVFNLTTGS